MNFKLLFSSEAKRQFEALQLSQALHPQFKAVRKALGLMETNLRHPSLQPHEFTSLKGPNGEKVFESYAQNQTPGAYRIFWYYGSGKNIISIVSIVSHP